MEFNPLERQALSKETPPANPAEAVVGEEASNVVQMPQTSESAPVTDSFGNFLGMAKNQEEANNLIRQAADDRREAA